jgi:hypothetical protein
MKTPLQQIIDRAGLGIEIHVKEVLNPNNSNIEKNRHTYLLNLCRMFKGLASELLEVEKQQREKTAIDMVNIYRDSLNEESINMEEKFNTYYSEAFGL